MPDLTASYFVSTPPGTSWNASPPPPPTPRHCFLHGTEPLLPLPDLSPILVFTWGPI